jgi:hypothetical protein
MTVVTCYLPTTSTLVFSLPDIYDNRFCTYVTDGITGRHIEIQCHFINITSACDGNFLKNEKICSTESLFFHIICTSQTTNASQYKIILKPEHKAFMSRVQ